MPQWLEVNNSEVNVPEEKLIRDVVVSTLVPPQDVPNAVCGYFNDISRQFVIEFRYPLNTEEAITKRNSGHISLCVGKKSNRLYAIRIDIDPVELVPPELLEQINIAVGSLAKVVQNAHRFGNYAVIKCVISSYFNELIDLALKV